MQVPNEPDLSSLRILVVEDTMLVADLIEETLRDHGCTVIGPVPRLEQGLLLAAGEQLDGALLDVNLAGERCFPIAEALAARDIPFGFLTGYRDEGIPAEYRAVARLSKPFSLTQLVEFVALHFQVSVG